MCPACIETAAVMAAGAASTGGIFALCIGRIRRFLTSNNFNLIQKLQGK
jgi:hypothetical protein